MQEVQFTPETMFSYVYTKNCVKLKTEKKMATYLIFPPAN